MGVRLWQVFARHQMHDRSPSEGQPQGAEGHRAVQEPALVDKPQDFGPRHALGRPIGWKGH